MRAAVFERPGEGLKIYDDIEIIDPRAGEVRVRVKHCGICHSDLSMVNGVMPEMGQPIILGHEASGVVDVVGEGVTDLVAGDHVVLTPIAPCGTCYYCVREEYSLCINGMSLWTNTLSDGETGLSRGGETILRGVGLGAFAEYVIVPQTGAIKVDKSVPLETVCVIGCALQTGVGAVLNTAAVEPGATVVIMGAGGIGIAATQGARIAGAALILVSDPVAARREAALGFGATHVIDPGAEDLHARCLELTADIGMDYAFETAGVAKLIEEGLLVTRPGGTIVCVGAPPLDDGIQIANVVLFAISEKKLCGCILGSSNSLRDIPRLIELWKDGQLDMEGMITRRLPLEDINLGFDDLAHSRGIRTVIDL
ncbi:MAG: S-(hydroxymethyl)glutathione dehydrogenase/alcohol dehydrogenase [Halieaceae bacterium]|jgi:S-(hydroxymethyl)glutathione dehydrogenase/alcohol dehydrogenase